MRMLIRVDADLSSEVTSAFPQLTPRRQPSSTTLTGELVDQNELYRVIDYLNLLGIDVVTVLTIPDSE